VKIEFDPAKRQATLDHRGLDMARAVEIFRRSDADHPDDRWDYGEPRFITIGPPRWPDGRHGLDSARRGPPHRQPEEGQ